MRLALDRNCTFKENEREHGARNHEYGREEDLHMQGHVIIPLEHLRFGNISTGEECFPWILFPGLASIIQPKTETLFTLRVRKKKPAAKKSTSVAMKPSVSMTTPPMPEQNSPIDTPAASMLPTSTKSRTADL